MVHYFFKIHEQPAVEDDGNGENVGWLNLFKTVR